MSRDRRQRGSQLTFSRRELFDYAVAWLALSVAFTIFVGTPQRLSANPSLAIDLLGIFVPSVGVAFMLHELGHKITAVRFGQRAAFRAHYGMLGVAVVGSLAGFLFAAPGAVVHVGRITDRENGLIALAGPAVNLILVAAFAPLLFLGGLPAAIGTFGVLVNAFLAAFNLLPVGPLDGRTVFRWHPGVFVVAFAASVGVLAGALLFVGIPRVA